jgi:hypothetical protein
MAQFTGQRAAAHHMTAADLERGVTAEEDIIHAD